MDHKVWLGMQGRNFVPTWRFGANYDLRVGPFTTPGVFRFYTAIDTNGDEYEMSAVDSAGVSLFLAQLNLFLAAPSRAIIFRGHYVLICRILVHTISESEIPQGVLLLVLHLKLTRLKYLFRHNFFCWNLMSVNFYGENWASVHNCKNAHMFSNDMVQNKITVHIAGKKFRMFVFVTVVTFSEYKCNGVDVAQPLLQSWTPIFFFL